MIKKKTIVNIAGGSIVSIAIAAYAMKKRAEKTTYSAEAIHPIKIRKRNFYEKYIKRVFDIVCAIGAIVVFSPLYLIVAGLVKLKLGSPVIFSQNRPGLIDLDGRETIFKMYKFRTMTDERDENGELLPDNVRLTKFGKWLRNTSLDELPEAFNILNGTMSVIGPRPQLVRDMVFMSDEQRERHTAKPGLSGLAQINGRNDISWDEKFNWDLEYIKNIGLMEDVRIILSTVKKAFIERAGITQEDMATAEDYGDSLLRNGKISKEKYDKKQKQAKDILFRKNGKEIKNGMVSIIMPSYNTALYIESAIQSVLNQSYTNWELIIVDDCSTDNTRDILAKIKDSRIRYFINETNSGAAVCRNRALREAKGQWIAFLDSDDLWLPYKLERQITFMKKNGYNFSYTNYEEMDWEGKKTGIIVSGPKKVSRTGMYKYCWPGCLTVMYNVEVVGVIQIRDIRKNNDYAMWLKVCRKTDCYLLDETLAVYRRGRSGSISSHNICTMVRWHYKLFREAEGLNPVASHFNTARNLFWGVYKKKRYLIKNRN